MSSQDTPQALPKIFEETKYKSHLIEEEEEEVEERPARRNEAKYDHRVRFVQKAIEIDEKTAVYTLNYF